MIAVAFAALTGLAMAAPAAGAINISSRTAEVEGTVHKRQSVTHLFVCDSANFNGRCENLESNRGQCYNLLNGWNDVISSLGPDQGTTCTLWENNDCTGRSLGGIVNPGINNLVDFSFNDIASSYRCS